MYRDVPRGLTVGECAKLVQAARRLSPSATAFKLWKYQRDELLIRLLYETWARISELLNVDVADIDLELCAMKIKHPKGRARFKTKDGKRVHIDTVYQGRWVFFGDCTRNLIIRHLGGRKKGNLILSSLRKKLSTREAERIVDHYARLAGIQKVIGYTANNREVRLVTCKALREAGERHTDEAGGDRDATARIAGHTVRTKEAYYKRGNFEEDRKVVRSHHPFMREERPLEEVDSL